ncbi:MAG TPA: hypothetical protein VH518_15165 [Tepidisphaeraceae bacterium]
MNIDQNIHEREGDATAAPVFNSGPVADVAIPTPTTTAPLAALLTRHILQDGEVILLILKPSIFFVVLSMLRFTAVVLIVMLASKLFDEQIPGTPRTTVEIGIFLLGGRLMWSVLQWMSQLYILTDLRIVRLSGVLQLNIFDCPLRKVARTRILYTVRERIFRLGSIEIIPSDEQLPIGVWQTVSRPVLINEQIVAAVNRAKQRRCASNGA